MSGSCGGGAVCSHEAERLTDWKDKLVLVTGEPGMGKSTLLLSIAQEMKKKEPDSWVVLVVLPDYTSVLHKVAARDISWQHVEDILTRAVSDQRSTDPELERSLLRDSLQRRGNISVLLDAVDEVSPVYTGHVLAIVRSLLDSKVSRLWVTSRQVLQEDLRRELKALPLVLAHFNDEQQKTFLREYLAQHTTDCSAECSLLEEKLGDLLELANTSGSVAGRHLCDVPLHAMMVATTLIQSTPTNENFLEALTVNSMYTSFVDEKRKHFYEKRGEDLTKLELSPREKIERELFIDIHMKCSLAVVFTQEELFDCNIPNYKEDIELFLNDITRERTGFIDGLDNNIPRFVHFTFAEYFAARWLVNEFLSRRAQIDQQGRQTRFKTIQRWILKAVSRQFRSMARGRHYRNIHELLLHKKYEFLRRVFDERLSVGLKLHEAVLTGDLDLVKRLLQSGAAADVVDRGGRLALHLAAAYGRSDVVRELQSAGSPVSTLDQVLGWSSLRYADRYEFWDVAELLLQSGAQNNDLKVLRSRVRQHNEAEVFESVASAGLVEMVKLLLRLGSKVTCRKRCNYFPLHAPAARGHTEVVNVLLAHNADANKTDKHERTPLLAAAVGGHTEVINVLLAHNADINKADDGGETPLLAAVERGHTEVVNVLLAHDADLNKTDNSEKTPLLAAAARGYTELVNVLLAHNSNINNADFRGRTPLHAAAASGQTEVVNVLLAHNADLNKTDGDGETPLLAAAAGGSIEIANVLLAHNANINNTDKHKISPLIAAAARGSIEVVNLLLAHNADINNIDDDGRTPIRAAAGGGHTEVVNMLLAHNSDINKTDFRGRTPLHVAAARGHTEVVNVLLAHNADLNNADDDGETPLLAATAGGYAEVMDVLLAHNADLNKTDKHGRTPLHIAAAGGHTEVVNILIVHNAKINQADFNGYTPLHVAALAGYLNLGSLIREHDECIAFGERCHLDLVRLLLAHGADVHVAGTGGHTALTCAAFCGESEAVRLLLEHGADVNRCNLKNNTALHVAVERGHLDAVRELLEARADISLTNTDGHTALDIARTRGHSDIERLVLAAS